MRLAAPLLLCAFGLIGCAAPPSTQGNFLGAIPAGAEKTVVEDAVRQLSRVYPPATTRFALQDATPDAFGQGLTASLRAKGYEVQESPHPMAKAQLRAADTPAAAGAPLALRYVLDRAGGDLYRLTLLIGNQALTRAYLPQQGAIVPAGAWVRQEGS